MNRATVRWNHHRGADEYEIEHERVDEVEDDRDGTVTTSGNHHEFIGLDTDQEYRYRIRAKGNGVTSEWTGWLYSYPFSAVYAPRLTVPSRFQESSYLEDQHQGGPVVSWGVQHRAALHDVSIWDETRSGWRTTPFRPKGWDQRVTTSLWYEAGTVQTAIKGLVPGTSYAVRARSQNGNVVTDWTDPIVVTTDGVRPSDAPGIGALPVEKMPPTGLTAAVSGTTATLSWTAGTNTNYVVQQVWRREVGVTPLDWTKVVVGLTDTSYADAGLVSGKQYVYRIKAEKSNGKGGVSNAVTVTIR